MLLCEGEGVSIATRLEENTQWPWRIMMTLSCLKVIVLFSFSLYQQRNVQAVWGYDCLYLAQPQGRLVGWLWGIRRKRTLELDNGCVMQGAMHHNDSSAGVCVANLMQA